MTNHEQIEFPETVAEGLCRICGKNPAVICNSCHAYKSKTRRQIYKKRLIHNAKGCKMCGIKDKDVLTIHHTDPDADYYDERYVDVLCMNCHFGKTHKQNIAGD